MIPVISSQPILYQLPYGAKNRGVCFMVFSINSTDPHLPQKESTIKTLAKQPLTPTARPHCCLLSAFQADGKLMENNKKKDPNSFLLHMAIGKELAEQK